MSGGIAIGFVDLLSFCLNPIAFVALQLVVSGAKLVLSRLLMQTGGITSIGLCHRTLFRMIIERIDLALLRLKQGFDSPRERQRLKER